MPFFTNGMKVNFKKPENQKDVLFVNISSKNNDEILKENIIKAKGLSPKQKILNFTAQSVKGSPKSWDAWEWPGYYLPACPGFSSALVDYARHQNDVAVVE
jgi:hypothetical protein